MNENIVLISKTCIYNNCSLCSYSVNGKNRYCPYHVMKKCAYHDKPNICGEIHCNSLVPLVEYKSSFFCYAHYKLFIKECNFPNCKKKRDNFTLSFDKNWYCKYHSPSNTVYLTTMILCLQNKLPIDIILYICNTFLKNQTFKLPL